MSLPLIINGVTYDYPTTDDTEWGPDATDWAAAVTSGMLQKSGGLFQLLAEADFGTSFGLKSLYYKTRAASPADDGQFRLGVSDVVNWRNNADDGNLGLAVDGSDNLTFNGAPVVGGITVDDTATIHLDLTASLLTADIVALSIDNSMISSSAAIAYSKLALTGSIVNADISASAAIAYSKLNLTGSVVNADVNASAAIAYSKLNLSASIVNADVSASAAIAYSKLALTGAIVNADVSASAAIAYSKLAALTISRALVSDGSGFVSAATTTATEIGYVNGVTSAIQTQINTKTSNPMTTGGDIIYGGTSGVPTRLANGTAGQALLSAGTTLAPVWSAIGTPTLTLTNATSSAKTPAGSSQFHQLTNNSVSLTAGTYELIAGGFFNNSGSAAYTEIGFGLYGANGADSGSTPTTLGATANLTVNSVYAKTTSDLGVYLNAILNQPASLSMAPVIVTTTATVSVFVVTYSSQVTSANARVTGYLTARRIYL